MITFSTAVMTRLQQELALTLANHPAEKSQQPFQTTVLYVYGTFWVMGSNTQVPTHWHASTGRHMGTALTVMIPFMDASPRAPVKHIHITPVTSTDTLYLAPNLPEVYVTGDSECRYVWSQPPREPDRWAVIP